MLLHSNPLFRIYFGDAKDQIFPRDYLNLPAGANLLEIEPYTKLKKSLNIDHQFFLRQLHSDQGMIVGQEQLENFRPFTSEGDFLITKENHVGLGVMTADCLPIVFHDSRNNVAAIAHAGWKGSVQKIAVKTVERMQKEFGTQLEHLRIYFGPSAKSCCYKVKKDFLEQLESFSYADKAVYKLGDYLFFDIPGFNKFQLEEMGVKKEAFRLNYNICTICDETFHSYRRDGKKTGHQMTVVSLI